MTSIADRDHMGPVEPISDRTPITLALLLAVVALVGTVMIAWSNLNGRVTNIEAHGDDRDKRLERIETKLDRILEHR